MESDIKKEIKWCMQKEEQVSFLAEKEVFVLTTNIDMQFERIFQKERICDYQGNSGWEMTYKNEKVFYACLNQKKSSTPEHIKDKGIYIAGDLAETLRDLKENIAGKEMW